MTDPDKPRRDKEQYDYRELVPCMEPRQWCGDMRHCTCKERIASAIREAEERKQAEIDALREALSRVYGISYPHPSRNFDTMIVDMGMINDICRAVSRTQSEEGT
jgi:hypothetical protein